MKLEKAYRSKPTRTIQKMNNGNSRIQFIDNCPSKCIQADRKRHVSNGTQTINGFEGLLKDNGARKKEHNVLTYGTEDARMQQRGQEIKDKNGVTIETFPPKSKTLPEGFKNKKNEQPSGWATTGFYTVDRYNNYSWRDFPLGINITINGKKESLDPYFSIFNPLYLRQKRTDKKIRDDLGEYTKKQVPQEKDQKRVLDFQKGLLDHPNYSPLKTLRESDDFVKAKEPVGKQSKNESKGVSGEEIEIAKSKFELQTRRACKFGLEYMANKEKTRAERGEIAFLSSVYGNMSRVDTNKLEPTNSDSILNKTKTTNRTGTKASSERVPITTSEQRKLFRIRSGFVGIHFFNSEGKEEKAPWNKYKESWNKYEKARLEKYKKLAKSLKIKYSGTITIKELKSKVDKGLDTYFKTDKSLSERIWLYNKIINNGPLPQKEPEKK